MNDLLCSSFPHIYPSSDQNNINRNKGKIKNKIKNLQIYSFHKVDLYMSRSVYGVKDSSKQNRKDEKHVAKEAADS